MKRKLKLCCLLGILGLNFLAKNIQVNTNMLTPQHPELVVSVMDQHVTLSLETPQIFSTENCQATPEYFGKALKKVLTYINECSIVE